MTKTKTETKVSKAKTKPEARMEIAKEEQRKPGRPATKPKVEKTPGKKGRPIDPNSTRQQRLNEMEAKRKAGELKRGRPTSAESNRQKKLAEMEAKRKAGELKRGRPAMDPELKAKLAAERKAAKQKEKEAKLAAIEKLEESTTELEGIVDELE